MRSVAHWAFAIVLGVIAAATSWFFVDWRYAAVTTGLLWLVGGFLSTRAWADLESCVETTMNHDVALWQAVPVVVLPFVVLPVTSRLGLSLADETGVYLLVGGVAFVSFFAGIGTALAYLDRTAGNAAEVDGAGS